MQKWAGMLVETGKAFVDPSAMMTQMREDSDFWNLPPLTCMPHTQECRQIFVLHEKTMQVCNDLCLELTWP